MASIHKEARSGKTQYRLQFLDKDKRRRSIRLGTINKKSANAIRVKVEDLLSASISGISPSDETARWLATLGDDLVFKLKNAGLGDFIPKRKSSSLGAFLQAYIDGRKADAADSTVTNFKQLQASLVGFFGSERDLRSIAEGEADDWRQSLTEGYADATINRHVKRTRQIFKAAKRKGLVDSNPFSEVRGGSEVNNERQHFVDIDTITKVLEACPDVEWQVIVALARFGGVRTPSETLRLRWADIDWKAQRFVVTSPKTQKQGKPWRVTPLFPELQRYLELAYDFAPKGTEYVINRYRNTNSNLRTRFMGIIKRAGVSPWPKIFQNLRASRETELANQFPLHVVTEWLGNTPSVATKHYLQVTDAHYE